MLWIIAIAARNPIYLAKFNINDAKKQTIPINLKDLVLTEDCQLINMWTKEDMEIFSNDFSQTISLMRLALKN